MVLTNVLRKLQSGPRKTCERGTEFQNNIHLPFVQLKNPVLSRILPQIPKTPMRATNAAIRKHTKQSKTCPADQP